MTQLALDWPVCVLPGCTNPTGATGAPCADCLAVFDGSLGGWRIVAAPGPALTAEQIAARDAEVAAAYAGHAEQVAAAHRVLPGDGGERKRNQRCWMCDDRRTCTRQPQGWECDECREVQ